MPERLLLKTYKLPQECNAEKGPGIEPGIEDLVQMTEWYADVIVDISHEKLDRPFQYHIPESMVDMVWEGVCVQIPFGAGNKLIKGYVINVTQTLQFDRDKIKDIYSVEQGDVTIEDELIRLAGWMKRYYGATMIQALKTVIPVKQKCKPVEKKLVTLLLSKEAAEEKYAFFLKKHQAARARVLEALLEEPEIPYSFLTEKKHVSSVTLKALAEQGILEIQAQTVYRNPLQGMEAGGKLPPLSGEQRHIVERIRQDREQGLAKKYLIHGITGSGKTRVYLELAKEAVEAGGQVIVLIPEIALTYQTVMRFYKLFGDRVSVINSTLSPGEKYDQFERAKKGELDVVIGPRSALFTPFPGLSLIIIDEEHETSYKSETMPRYHARETAAKIGQMRNASVVLGSATPSVDAYYGVQNGEYELFTLTRRLTGGTLPKVHIADLRKELKEGNRTAFSRALQERMADRLAKGEQTILFLNRRGYAGFISCRSCGYVVKCPHCDVSLTEHRDGSMQCHYCGYTIPIMKACPECGSPYIMGFKAGTQQIETAVHKMFPAARVLRMDADTTKTKGSYEKILSAFADGEADILVGTQMIVKGHDFPNVTLVGVLAADLSINGHDFTAGERTFQLLTQAAGRAGRGDKPGEVVIQTYQPDHYSVVHAANQDYQGFYEEEICYREMMDYPPVAHMLTVLLLTEEENRGMELANGMAARVKDGLVIGPARAVVGKINDVYRTVLYVKNGNYEALIQAKESMDAYFATHANKKELVQYDFSS